ncbi:hypothetical protein PWG71_28410 [Nocardiopsis sp. N85]|uniref:hypothetical protein n=1 Tax=Nocardiopsis sp. N85 TaxID=3029400 RepID=UPI00237EF631|nr:hypothetical protein [Nocardiopsis sp. N85]MDE3725320.1 hypothetical protein [Nocardiopsis sp. N85]
MAYYRIRTNDGSSTTHQALRMRADASALYLEDRSAGLWRVVRSWRLGEVVTVQRRFTEHDGTWTWLTEPLPAPTGVRGWN